MLVSPIPYNFYDNFLQIDAVRDTKMAAGNKLHIVSGIVLSFAVCFHIDHSNKG